MGAEYSGASRDVIFGGETWPLGWSLGLIAAAFGTVVDVVAGWPENDGALEEQPAASLSDLLIGLCPLQAPYTRRLLVDIGVGWTAYFDNSIGGGDPFSWTSHLSRALGCRAIIATHVPRDQSVHPATQWHVFGPDGEPPLHYVRTVDAGIFDSGRWSFETSGSIQAYEDTAAYGRRLVRDRLTRDMLFAYMRAEGVTANWGPGEYRSVRFEEDTRTWSGTPRTLDLHAARALHHPRPA